MKDTQKAQIIILTEQLRLIESEIFRLTSKYGVKTIDELDKLVYEGKLSEEMLGEDLFTYDYLLSEKKEKEKELLKYNINKEVIWKNLKNLIGLPKLNTRI